jgi:hypothetical protein
MCAPNKFLSGALVWFPELQCCAIIGHCCAGKEARDEAAREHKWRAKRDYEESTLLAGLPLLADKAQTLKLLRPAAEEARRIYRRFRKDVPTIHQHLRTLKTQCGGYLTVTELVESPRGPRGYQGPMGFRGNSDEETREIELGVLTGLTALIRDYNPVTELNHVTGVLESMEARPGEEAAMEFIVSMSEAQRRAAVAILQEIDRGYAKFISKIRDFSQFFTRENIDRIHAYGMHPANPFTIEAKFELIHRRPRILMRHHGERCQLLITVQIDEVHFPWPTLLTNNIGND